MGSPPASQRQQPPHPDREEPRHVGEVAPPAGHPRPRGPARPRGSP